MNSWYGAQWERWKSSSLIIAMGFTERYFFSHTFSWSFHYISALHINILGLFLWADITAVACENYN